MKIALITDIHIDDEGILPLDIDTRTNLTKTLAHIQEKTYDLLICTGDLCNKTGETHLYEWIKAQLAMAQVPYLIISGNHDTSSVLAEVFEYKNNLHGGELYYTQLVADQLFIFLDTSRAELSDQQWEWLEDQIKNIPKDVYIFMHHPPVYVGSLFMEPRYSFTQIERFQAMCKKYVTLRFHVFVGHFHMERTIIQENLNVFITPSTFVQIDPDSADFVPITNQIGYREIVLKDKINFSTALIYH